ncbi:spore coat protein [Alicyclobacillaceae bacterium I2511]|nr:spore coat protein [Alicyclobacillaceae bacterium I2511]
MSLMTHEAVELNELLLSCTNTINSMGVFLSQVKDPTLKSILEKQIGAHVQDYNIKSEWIKNGSSNQKLAVPAATSGTTTGTSPSPQAVTPNPGATNFDDRAIATSYLLTLKRAGREYAWATFEAANPQLRSFLEDAFTMCSRHAVEVSQWMGRHGYYPSETAPASLVQKIGQTYEFVRETVSVH